MLEISIELVGVAKKQTALQFEDDGLIRSPSPTSWFITFTAMAGAILNTFGRFAVSSFTPVFLNIMKFRGMTPKTLQYLITDVIYQIYMQKLLI